MFEAEAILGGIIGSIVLGMVIIIVESVAFNHTTNEKTDTHDPRIQALP